MQEPYKYLEVGGKYKNCPQLFCNDAVEQEFGPGYFSVNQALAGPPNPKTLEPLDERILHPITDFAYWTPGDYISHGAVNDFNDVDMYGSGACQTCPEQSFQDWTLPQYLSDDYIMSYSKNQPINGNLGISMTPDFADIKQNYPPPVSEARRKYVPPDYDSDVCNYINGVNPAPNLTRVVDNIDIYDPRQYGYGSNNRAYNSGILGQPRYDYRDIDSIRRPMNIKRNIVDQLDYVSQVAANNAYIDRTNEYRKNLQESLMRKRNSELYQLRQAPLSRSAGAIGFWR